jgi:hypothetical protein
MREQTEQNICAICAETYNARRPEVKCISCSQSACRKCCEMFISESGDHAKCMYPNCGKSWSRKFLVDNFTKTYVTKDYKKHLENVYFEKVKALLPATQELVEEEVRVERVTKLTREHGVKMAELRRQFVKDRREILHNFAKSTTEGMILVHKDLGEIGHNAASVAELWESKSKYGSDIECGRHSIDDHMAYYLGRSFSGALNCSVIRGLIRRKTPMPTDFLYLSAVLMKERKAELYVPWTTKWVKYLRPHYSHISDVFERTSNEMIATLRRNLEAIPGYNQSAKKETPNERRFVRGCPKEECRGFLSTAWKCGLCDIHVCSKCHIPNDDGEDHECDPDAVATAKMITSESKPCPSCHINITKIDGCNQMWCTQCKTAWNWISGKIETKVHNPHYFEYMRNRDTNEIPERNPNEVRCGREIDNFFHDELKTVFLRIGKESRNDMEDRSKFSSDEYIEVSGFTRITALTRTIIHISHHNIDADIGEEPDTTRLRIDYLREKISLAEFKKRVQMLFKKHSKKLEIRDLLVMFRQVATEILYRYKDAVDKSRDLFDLVNAIPIMDEINELEKYVNRCLVVICSTYQSRPLWLAVNPIRTKADGYGIIGLQNPRGYITYDLTA